jgi:hypothetical protein
MASGRWASGSTHWGAWIGIGVLWTVYVAAAIATIHVWRHALRCRFVRTTT